MFDDQLIPNASDFSIPLNGRRTFGPVAVDPQNFLRTTSLGLSPHNIELTVRYRIGGGPETNCPARSIRQPSKVTLAFGSTGLDPLTKGRVEGSIGCLNFLAMDGGGSAETVDEINAAAGAFFAAQNRIVTREDAVARAASLPAKFGKVEKVFARPSISGNPSYDLYVLSRDPKGNLSKATPTLKSNLSTYMEKFRIFSDGIDIFDGGILDIRVYFGVIVYPGRNKSEVLLKCTQALERFLRADSMEIEQPIVISKVIAVIDSIPGVHSVYELSFTNVFGIVDNLEYSDDRFSISDNIRNGSLVCPEGTILHVRYPSKDIVGSAR
jgi:hypothetical protein